MTEATLTYEYLTTTFNYSPETGLFTRIRKASCKNAIGDIAVATRPDGYITIAGNDWRDRVLAHRAAWLYMTGSMPDGNVDHINQVRDDNRWLNLRIATKSENARNAKRRVDNTSGCCGVSWNKGKWKWEAYIAVDGVTTRLGRHVDFFEAVCARKSAEIRLGYHP